MEKKTKKSKLKWWQLLIIAIIAIYIIVGGIFAMIIYKNYPDTLSNGKKYPDQQKVTVFMTKIYPYPAAMVNGHIIWVKDFYKQLDSTRYYANQAAAQSNQTLPTNSELEKQILEQMIDIEILRQQANQHGIKITKAEIDKSYQDLSDQLKQQGQQDIKTVLKQIFNLSEPDFKKLMADQLLIQKIQDEMILKIDAKHILVKDENLAKDLIAKISKGEISFEDAAKQYSEDTGSRENGGELGWFSRGMMVKPFEDAVFVMKKGEVSAVPVKTDFGYHVIKVEDIKGTVDKAYNDWFNEILKQAKIKRFINPKTSSSDSNVVSPQPTSSVSSTPTASAQ